MTGYYDITTVIKNQLILDDFVNTVTIGDIYDIDLKKQTIFPLSHIIVNSTTKENNVLRFNISIMCMDIVDKSKEPITDSFLGNDNEQDVLNTQLAVALRVVEVLQRGANTKSYVLDGNVEFEYFTERFENYLAGVACTFDVLVPNTMTACDAGAALVTCPNVTYTITDDAGNTLYSGTITSGGSLLQEIADSTAVLKNTLGTTLSTTSINAEGSSDIVAPDVTYTNSDGTFTGSKASGTTLNISDSQINVNSVDQGDVVSVKTIDVNITDGVSPVTPDAVSLVGNTLTIQVPAGGVSPVGATLMKTGQTVSYATGDDGDLEAGRATDFFTLAVNNPFGNTNRFTDELGGSTYTNNIVIDWSTYDVVAGTVLGYRRTLLSNAAWATQCSNAQAVSIGTFTTGWRLANIYECTNIANIGAVQAYNYSPFNLVGAGFAIWTSNTLSSSATTAYYIGTNPFRVDNGGPKAAAVSGFAVRTFTVSGTTLS